MAGFGGTIKLQGEDSYKRALKDIAQNLTLINSEMKVVNASYDKNDNSIKALTSRNDTLNKKLDEQKNKVKVLDTQLQEARKVYGDNSTEVKKYETQLNNAQAEVVKTTREIEKNANAMDDAEKATEDNTDALEDFTQEEDKAGKGAIKMGDLIKAHVISDAIVGGFKLLGNAIKDVAGKFLDFTKMGVENASNLAEAQNVVDVAFGESASKVEEFSKTAATEFGMTELSVKQFSGTMGAMLSSMGLAEEQSVDMSLSLVGLTGDMASFYNLDHETAWEKIRSGISGQTEPLKQLGINMSVANLEAYALSQGITTAYSEMTEAEKVTLRYNYLMETTANAQGDFARTSDGYANQTRILSLQIENLATDLGESLLPYLNDVITAFNDMLSGEIGVEEGIGRITQVVVDLANKLIENLPTLLDAGMTMLNTILQGFMEALPSLIPVVTQLIDSLLGFIVANLPMIIEAGIQIVLSLVQGISNSLPMLVPAVVDAILVIVDNLLGNVNLIIDTGIQLIVGLGQGLINAIPTLISRIPQIISSLITTITKDLPKFLTMGVTILKELGAGLIKAIPNIVSQIPQIIKGIVDALRKGISNMVKVGGDLLKGLWDGISGWASNLWSKISNLGKGIVKKFKSVLGINSPSKVMADEVGINMAKGIGEGFEDTIGSVSDEMSNSIPTEYDINVNGNKPLNNFDNMVLAFKEALKEVKIVLDDDEVGTFVTNTIERVVYN